MSIEDDKRADLRVYRDISDMIATPGWRHYCRILEGHIKERTNAALAPVMLNAEFDGMSQVLSGEASKGAIMGLRLALSLPSGIIEQHKRNFPSAEDE